MELSFAFYCIPEEDIKIIRMYKERSIEDNCLLCKEKKADKTNSHIVPASMLKYMIGKRDYEESYLIDSKEIIIDQYFGRSNLKNDNTNKKSHHFAKDYWFCTECEKRLGNVEDKVAPRIERRIRNTSDLGFLELTPNGHKYFSYNENRAEFELFICSIIWRLNLYYQFLVDKEIMDLERNEHLRIVLLNNLPRDSKTIVRKNWETPPHIILRSNVINPSRCFVFTDDRYKNPYLYFITDFTILFFPTGFSENFQNDDFELSGFLERELVIQNEADCRIGLIDSNKWESVIKIYIDKLTSKKMDFYSTGISRKYEISIEEAMLKLQTRVKELIEVGLRPTQSFEEAYKELME